MNKTQQEYCSVKCRNANTNLRRTNWLILWTDDDIQYLREHYPDEGAHVVAETLGRGWSQVREKANKLKICLTREARYRLVHEAARRHMIANNPVRTPGVLAKMAAYWRNHPTSLEVRLYGILAALNVAFTAQQKIGHHVVDATVGALVIQADGEYWHGHPDLEPLSLEQQIQQARDKTCDAYLLRNGWHVVRVWDRDVTKPVISDILRKHGLL